MKEKVGRESKEAGVRKRKENQRMRGCKRWEEGRGWGVRTRRREEDGSVRGGRREEDEAEKKREGKEGIERCGGGENKKWEMMEEEERGQSGK